MLALQEGICIKSQSYYISTPNNLQPPWMNIHHSLIYNLQLRGDFPWILKGLPKNQRLDPRRGEWTSMRQGWMKGPQHSHWIEGLGPVRSLRARYFKHYFSQIPAKKEPSGVTVHHYWPYSPWAASGDVDGSLKPVQGRFSNHDAQPKTPPTIIWPKTIIIHQYFPEIAGRGFPLLTQLPFWGKNVLWRR